MQKAIAISLSFLLLVSSIGVAINKHYCGDRLESISIELFSSKSCCCGELEMVMNCCKDETVVAQLDDDKVPPSDKTEINSFQTILQPFSSTILSKEAQVEEKTLIHNNSPPLQEKLFLLHSSFTFYG